MAAKCERPKRAGERARHHDQRSCNPMRRVHRSPSSRGSYGEVIRVATVTVALEAPAEPQPPRLQRAPRKREDLRLADQAASDELLGAAHPVVKADAQ